MKKTLIVLKRIGLTLLCIFIYSLVMEALKAKGIQLGFVPTAILSFPVFYCLFRIWAKRPQPMKERPEADLHTATNDAVRMMPPPEQIDEPAPSEQSNYAGGTGGKGSNAPSAKRSICVCSKASSTVNRFVIVLLSLALILSIGSAIYFGLSTIDLKKQLDAQNIHIQSLSTTITQLQDDLSSAKTTMNEFEIRLHETIKILDATNEKFRPYYSGQVMSELREHIEEIREQQ